MLSPLATLLAATLVAANPPPPDPDVSPDAPAPPNSAIVGGRHIQPRGDPDAKGISKRDADDVDRLYQELMQQSAPDARGTKGSPP